MGSLTIVTRSKSQRRQRGSTVVLQNTEAKSTRGVRAGPAQGTGTPRRRWLGVC